MKVDIKHEAVTKGLLFKKEMHQVSIQVLFSEEERAILKKDFDLSRMGMFHMPERFPDAKHITGPYVVPGNFLDNKPYVAAFETVARAKDFEIEVVSMLKDLKEAFAYHAAPGDSSSFEL